MFHIFCIFMSSLLISTNCTLIENLSNYQNSDYIYIKHISDFVNFIIENHFINYTCVAFVIDTSGNNTHKSDNLLMLDNILPQMAMVVIMIDENELLQTNLTEIVARYHLGRTTHDPWNSIDLLVQALDECRGFFFQTNRPDEFISILPHLYKVANFKIERKFIFMPVDMNSESPNLEKIFQTSEIGFVRDVLFLHSSINGCYPLTTHLFDNPILEVNHNLGHFCPDNKIKWNPPKLFKNLFPDKMKNLQKRPLRFSTLNYPPYHFFIDNDNKTLDGLEIRVVKQLAEMLNGSFKYFPILDDDLWGELDVETMEGTGLLGMLSRFEIEFAIGSFYSYEFTNRYLDHTIYYLRAAMHCVAPKPQVVFDWEGPLLPFTSAMWIALGLTLFVVPTALVLITRATLKIIGKRFARIAFITIGYSFFATLGMLVSQTSNAESLEPQRAPIDHLLLWVHITFLLVSNSYSSGLSAILTVQRTEKPIDTIYDMDRKHITWLALHEAFTYGLQPATEPAIERVINRFKAASNKEMEVHLKNPKTHYAYSIEVLADGNYAMGDHIQPWSMSRLRLMHGYLYYGWVGVVTSKGSPYTNKLNQLIYKLRESGILFYWEGDTARKSIGIRRTLAVSNSLLKETPPVAPLEWHHIQGTMLVLFCGYLLAFLVFIGENLKKINQKHSKLNKHRRD